MRSEAVLFGSVSLFFAIIAAVYVHYSSDPAGSMALTVSCLMSAMIAFFCWTRYIRNGLDSQDRPHAEIHERAGNVDFFPPHSHAPVVTALACALLGTGVIYGLWLFLIAAGLLAIGIYGFVFEYATRGP